LASVKPPTQLISTIARSIALDANSAMKAVRVRGHEKVPACGQV
jgi:hypothetical protein